MSTVTEDGVDKKNKSDKIPDDYIDKKCWLKREIDPTTGDLEKEIPPAITKERHEKGDIRYVKDEESHFEGDKSFAWLPDELHRRGIIEREHLTSAEIIKRLRDTSMRSIDPRIKHSVIKVLTGGESKGNLNAEDIYFSLTRGLVRKKCVDGSHIGPVKPMLDSSWEVVENICFNWQNLNQKEFEAMYKFAPSIHFAFEDAQKVLAELFKIA